MQSSRTMRRLAIPAVLVLASLLASAPGCQVGPDAELAAYEETAPTLRCGTAEPSDGGKLALELATSQLPGAHDDTATGGTIRVHVHVLLAAPGLAHGDVPDAAIHQQLAVLDAAYASAGLRFELASIERTINASWVQLGAGTAAELAAKGALRRGTRRDLNLYLADPGHGISGYATFPSQATAAPHLDGVVMRPAALPGGTAVAFNLGDQTVHEVGHWLGLYHTFQADCAGNGDFVLDTPATSAPAFGCPMGRDTCGGDATEDPVRNYMDSTDDACMNAFTAGQLRRIRAQFNAYRRT